MFRVAAFAQTVPFVALFVLAQAFEYLVYEPLLRLWHVSRS